MRTRTPDADSPGLQPEGPHGPHSVFILPELAKTRQHDLTLLVLADGNTRSASSRGYAGGARKVVQFAANQVVPNTQLGLVQGKFIFLKQLLASLHTDMSCRGASRCAKCMEEV